MARSAHTWLSITVQAGHLHLRLARHRRQRRRQLLPRPRRQVLHQGQLQHPGPFQRQDDVLLRRASSLHTSKEAATGIQQLLSMISASDLSKLKLLGLCFYPCPGSQVANGVGTPLRDICMFGDASSGRRAAPWRQHVRNYERSSNLLPREKRSPLPVQGEVR